MRPDQQGAVGGGQPIQSIAARRQQIGNGASDGRRGALDEKWRARAHGDSDDHKVRLIGLFGGPALPHPFMIIGRRRPGLATERVGGHTGRDVGRAGGHAKGAPQGARELERSHAEQ